MEHRKAMRKLLRQITRLQNRINTLLEEKPWTPEVDVVRRLLKEISDKYLEAVDYKLGERF